VYIPEPTIENIVCKAKEMNADSKITFIMLGEHCDLDVTDLIAALNAEKLNYFGGLFPGVLYGETRSENGAVMVDLPVIGKPNLINNLESGLAQVPELNKDGHSANKKNAALIIVDGLAGNIAGFLTALFQKFANSVTYIGGGAGSLSLQQKPCLFTPEGFFQNAALLVFLDMECTLGVRHGWETIAGPLVATKTDKNKVLELNWENAYDVYRKVVESNSGQTFTENNFFDLAKGYPFGMIKEYAESIVRDPLSVGAEGELICVGEVPVNSVLNILKGTDTALVAAAGQAVADCLPAKGKNIKCCLIADCISRVLFLEAGFINELRAVKNQLSTIQPSLIPVGMLTLGEISSYGEGFLEFFNKTMVVGVFHDG
jgi:hypothetical protein